MLREALRPRAPDARGLHLEEILAEWPELEREDIQQALGYAAWAMEERVVPRETAAGK